MATGWDDHRDYMSVKRRKLQDQLEGIGVEESKIFSGVTIYVNGYTKPDSDTLRDLVCKHGGGYSYAPSSRVSHVIASNLPNSKIKALSANSSKVCRPEWVLDSVSAGTLLSTEKYELYNLTKSQGKIGFSPAPAKGEGQKAEPNLGEASTSFASAPKKGRSFVNEFYSHSRLHHLSTWSSELREFTTKNLPLVRRKYKTLPPSKSLRRLGVKGICHIDIDCFFVSVGLRDRPDLLGQPVAVTHARDSKKRPLEEGEGGGGEEEGIEFEGSDAQGGGDGGGGGGGRVPLSRSTSDIASCSYEAREYGIRNGMSVGEAVKLCPRLNFLPYEFEKYRAVSQTLYEIVITYSHAVEPVSCDEVFIEFSDYAASWDEMGEIVSTLRREIEAKTGCKVSAGISHNMLLARLATRKAKPNGQFHLIEDETGDYLKETPVSSLPGIGYKMREELGKIGVSSCGELRGIPLPRLREVFGPKTGYTLYCFARGIDNRDLSTKKERKSLSVEINYGMRFNHISEAETLIAQLSEELHSRVLEAGVIGSSVTLKLKIRQEAAPYETRKYLGHGRCDNVSRSYQLHSATNRKEEIHQAACYLLKQVSPKPSDIRGMGIVLNKLVSHSSKGSPIKGGKMADIRTLMTASPSKKSAVKGSGKSPLENPFKSEETRPAATKEKGKTAVERSSASIASESTSSLYIDLDLPPASQLDQSVLLSLPPDLQEEVFDSYSKRHQEMRHKEKDEQLSRPPPPSPLPSLSDISNGNPERFLNESRSHVKAWVALYPSGPRETDVGKFKGFLLWLLEASGLEMTHLVLACFRRTAYGASDEKWREEYRKVLSIIQEEVVLKYGSHLLIKP